MPNRKGVRMTQAMVQRLVEDDPIPAWLGGGHDWRRVYGRVAGNAQTVLVYEPESGARDAISVTVGQTGSVRFEGIGYATCADWRQDPSLPTLAWLTAGKPELEPVRYRPGKRCTLRSTGKQRMFVKCFADQRGAAINRDARLLYHARQQGWLGFGVARPAGWIARSRLLVQHAVPGTPIVDQLSGAAGQALAARLGAANASLINAPIMPEPQFTYADQMARTRKYARRLAKFLPGTPDILDDLLGRLAAVTPGNADRPIHGAPHAHQWLDGPDGLMLVDFDRFGRGDPELDAATFVAEADFEDDQTKVVGLSYLAAFSEKSPINASLFAAYRTHKHIAKALRVATAIRTDARARALSILKDAPVLLGGRP
jgi:Phosphotransferase enzyme family